MFKKRKNLSIIIASDLYALFVKVKQGIVTRFRRCFVIVDENGTKAFTYSSIRLNCRAEYKDELYSDTKCHFTLSKKRTLRFSGTDAHFPAGERLLCDVFLHNGKRTQDCDLYLAQGTVVLSDEALQFAPAHSYAVLFEEENRCLNALPIYAAAINDEAKSVLIIREIDRQKAILEVINQYQKRTYECNVCKTKSAIILQTTGEKSRAELSLTPLQQDASKRLKSISVYCINGIISLERNNQLNIKNQWLFSV